MKLHTPTPRPGNKRWYCGPFAYAAITGAGFEETRAAINDVRGLPANTGVMGTSTRTMSIALQRRGLKLQLHHVYHSEYQLKHTLNSWLKTLTKTDENVYLIELTHHWVTVKGRSLFIDNHTGHPVSAFAAPWQRKQVRKVYRVKGDK